MSKIESILKAIDSIEKQVKDLKLEVQTLQSKEEKKKEKPKEIQIGDLVVIVKPNLGQPSEGIVTRFNEDTGFYFVTGKNILGAKQTVRRLARNLRKKEVR